MRACVALLVVVAASSLALVAVRADTYLHSPRGGNNRLDEANRDRDNGNRLWDSQNNNRGGYNVGSVYYMVGSQMMVEWTTQHSCGDKTRVNCEIILQYACDDNIRDGTTTTTIPENPNDCYNYDCDTDLRFGRHESFKSYASCKYTTRNMGLFVGSQNLHGDAQRYTRQNPGGTRRGYECPEERDYYPYWQPTIWRDIAILTNDPKRCAAYRAESQNVKDRFYCEVPDPLLQQQIKRNKIGWIPIDQVPCEKLTYKDGNTTLHGVWKRVPAWGTAPPECRENQWSRDNHHGNVAGAHGQMATFNWTVPADKIHERCVLRMRYNISTVDIENWESDTSIQVGPLGNSSVNPLVRNPTPNRDPATLPVWEKYQIPYADVADSFNRKLNPANAAQMKNTREYVMKNNPRVDYFGSLLPSAAKSFLKTQLAINTAQYGRTFQDRSHRFAIRRKNPGVADDALIHNVQVRGKRGNIVQVYPGVEYDMTPNRLHVQVGEHVHFQWTGSNTNPHNNAGNGLAGTDRSNLVVLRSANYDDDYASTSPPTKGIWGNSYPGRVDDTPAFMGFSLADQTYLGTLQQVPGVYMPGAQFGGSMDQFDDAGTYFDLGSRAATQTGIYHYMSTRNNAFSNRSQKGKIVVSVMKQLIQAVGINGAQMSIAGGQKVTIPPDAFQSLTMVTVMAAPDEAAEGIHGQVSDFLEVSFPGKAAKPLELSLNYDTSPLHLYSVKRASCIKCDDWESVSGEKMSGGQATVWTDQSGAYTVHGELNGGAVAGIVIGCVVFCIIVAAIVYKVYVRNRGAKLPRNATKRAETAAAAASPKSTPASPSAASPAAPSSPRPSPPPPPSTGNVGVAIHMMEMKNRV